MTLEQMKQRKQEYGYTMAQLSKYSGVPLGTLQKIFTGETAHPRYATRQAIERVLAGERSSGAGAAADIHIPVTYDGGDDKAITQPEYVRENAPAYGVQPEYVQEAAFAYGAQREKRQGEYTIEDYYALPDDQRVELIDGVIYKMEAPGFVHQRIAGIMYAQIEAYIRSKGGDCIPLFSPVDVRLDCDDKTMVQPDLIILCDKDKIKRWGIMGAPDFILEVLSPSTRKKDCTKKLQKYTDAGVKEYWIIDPEGKVLIMYDFINDKMPCIRPLEGKTGLALYNGDLEIDLDEISGLIQDWPE